MLQNPKLNPDLLLGRSRGIEGPGFRVYGLGLRVWGLGFGA